MIHFIKQLFAKPEHTNIKEQHDDFNREFNQRLAEQVQRQTKELLEGSPFRGGTNDSTRITFINEGKVKKFGSGIEVVKKDSAIDVISALYPEYIFPLGVTRDELYFETNTGTRYSVSLDVNEEQANVLKQIIIKAQQCPN